MLVLGGKSEAPGEGMLRDRTDPRKRGQKSKLVRAHRIVVKQLLPLAPDQVDGIRLAGVTEAQPGRRAEIERPHAALKGGPAHARRNARMADGGDHMPGEIVSRLRRRDTGLEGIALERSRPLKSDRIEAEAWH